MPELKVLMLLLPLTYSTMLYLITNNIGTLGLISLVTVIIAGVITAILAGTNIIGTGVNSTGTLIIFILIFGGAFYGVSVAGLYGTLDDPNSLASVFYDAGSALGLNPVRGSAPDMSQANLYGSGVALAGADYPYKPIVDLIFGLMYALGLYFLISD